MKKLYFISSFFLLVLFFVSYAFSQTSEKPWTVEEYFQFIVENPSSSSDILSKNIENIDPNLRSLEEGIRELSPQKVVASLSGKNISLEQSIFFETIRDPFHVVRMHKYNQQSQAFKDRVLSYGLGQYASYMTTPLVLLSSFSFQNKEMVLKQIALAKVLIRYGASPNQSDFFGRFPIAMAAQKRNSELLDVLLNSGANPNKIGSDRKPTEDQYFNRFMDTNLQQCLYGSDDLGKRNISSPNWKISEAYECIRILLEHQADPDIPNIFGETVLLSSSCLGADRIVKLLQDYGAKGVIALSPGSEGAGWGDTEVSPYQELSKDVGVERNYDVWDYLRYGKNAHKKNLANRKQKSCFRFRRDPDDPWHYRKTERALKNLKE